MAITAFLRYLPSMRRAALALPLVCALVMPAQAQIRTDGTLGPAMSLTGPNFLINQALGRLAGSNLFYSFSVFNVGNAESATFITTTAGLANVISRVTGGTPSQINGLVKLQSTNAAPNFFFINPAGVVFGKGAQIDVPAGFHVSTANYLKFADGNFYADPNVVSTLSSAAPEAFGFLGTTRATVTLKDDAILGTFNAPFDIVAGDVTVDHAGVYNAAGDVRVIAVGGGAAEIGLTGTFKLAAGTLALSDAGLLATTPVLGVAAGNITVAAGTISISGTNSGIFSIAGKDSTGSAGNVDVSAAQGLTILKGGTIASTTLGSGNSGSVTVAAGSLLIDGQGSSEYTGIFVDAFEGSGTAGSVTINAGSLIIDGGTEGGAGITSSSAFGTGNAGAVQVTVAGHASIANGGEIAADTAGSGNAGAVTVSAGSLTISGTFTGISSNALSGSGNAGSVQVTVADQASIANGGRIQSQTRPLSTGNAGSITFTVGGEASILNGSTISSSTSGPGRGGAVTVSAGSLIIDGGTEADARITSTATGTGDAGSVQVTVAGHASLANGGEINADTRGSGNAGAVTVSAGSLTIDPRASGAFTGISSDALSGSGNAGSVQVTVADQASILNGGSIQSQTNDTSTGNAGSITFTVGGEASILNGGVISSSTSGPGRGGAVTVSAGSLIIDGGTEGGAGITSNAAGTGNAGSVQVTVAGHASIVNGGAILADTDGSGNAGAVTVSARSLTIDARGSGRFTGISSDALSGSGNAGSVQVTVADQASIVNGGSIQSDTRGSGNAGAVTVSAGSLTIDPQDSKAFTGISSDAVSGSGNAGSVQVTVADQASIVKGGRIQSDTQGSGNAGAVTVSAGSLTIDARGSENFTGISSEAVSGSGNAGSVQVTVADQASIVNMGRISSSTFTSGNAGSVTFSAGSLAIDGQGGIASQATDTATGNAGTVQVTVAGETSIANGGGISSSTRGPGRAGAVTVSTGSLAIDGNGGIVSQAERSIENPERSTGNGGAVQVTVADHASISNGGFISSSTFTSGDAGSVTLSAGSLAIDGQGTSDFTGIASVAALASTGNAGLVQVAVTGHTSIANGGGISSSTLGPGKAGAVTVSTGSLAIDGNGGIVSQAERSIRDPGQSTGNAGAVQVTVADHASISNNGLISSSTFTSGNAGSVTFSAGSLAIDGHNLGGFTGITSQAADMSTGNAGPVQVTVAGETSIANAGGISSSTLGPGKAGAVTVSTGSLAIDGIAGIVSQAERSTRNPGRSTGNAGAVQVTVADHASISNGGFISSSTFTSGSAGSVTFSAGSLTVDGPSGIFAAAGAGSSGQTGNVTVLASDNIALSNGGTISIQNFATVANPPLLVPTLLTVSAPTISLADGAQITAASSGNVAASDIRVSFGPQLAVSNAGISTSANEGNGGSVVISGTGALVLQNGQITTSVAGLQGNGGDITISAQSLVMETGFIQANTAAANASGGKVNIEVDSLVPSGSTLFVGGSTPFEFAPGVFAFNVIQAAAPTGVSGTIQISTPVLDIIGSISALPADFIDSGGLGRSPCAIVGGSSLSQVGRGGLPPKAGDLLWIGPVIEVPAPPPVRAPGSGRVAPPYLTAASTPC